MKLIQDPNKPKTKIEPTPFTQQEIDEISVTLLQELKRHGGIGLSANQIGINKRACVINVKEPLVLINPRVTEVSEESVVYVEQCLSMPKTMRKPVQTVRFKTLTVECDNLGTVIFSPDIAFSIKGVKLFHCNDLDSHVTIWIWMIIIPMPHE